ncbi:hypothetical protein SAMN05444483_102122 [Salegentibacter echinorum]|uniref:ATP synthase protein I n=1 Tax=Salegentibacter echinorum TaxID=1073325 RepID=A0A1M5DUN9_SALEC|nr:hypothetical protein [Salegentibacter echinorum]SHF70723.1 hypothetical protein SAMN05444483_102122 [Salegentibacter echinorum]
MKNDILAFLKILLPFSISLWLIQSLLQHYVFNIDFFYSAYSIYIFHGVATSIIYGILVLVYRNFKDKTGFAFMGLSLLKMLAAVLFLLPLVLSEANAIFANILIFFIPYFLFLVLETLYAVKLINRT